MSLQQYCQERSAQSALMLRRPRCHAFWLDQPCYAARAAGSLRSDPLASSRRPCAVVSARWRMSACRSFARALFVASLARFSRADVGVHRCPSQTIVNALAPAMPAAYCDKARCSHKTPTKKYASMAVWQHRRYVTAVRQSNASHPLISCRQSSRRKLDLVAPDCARNG
jgi:hypothetical protein